MLPIFTEVTKLFQTFPLQWIFEQLQSNDPVAAIFSCIFFGQVSSQYQSIELGIANCALKLRNDHKKWEIYDGSAKLDA